MGSFITQHVRKRPAGSRVRTVVRGKHRVRIAFPRGPQRKGSGRIIEVLHPRSENPKLCRVNPAELIVLNPAPGKKTNPGELVILANPRRRKNSAAGKELYQEFHGAESDRSIEVDEPQDMPKEAVVLGDLVSLTVKGKKGDARIDFAADGVRLASSANGRNLYFVGGAQNLDSLLGNFSIPLRPSETVRLGEAVEIVYRARKAMDNFQISDYVHQFGEESGKRPVAWYDPKIKRVYLEGGSYRVEAPGIID